MNIYVSNIAYTTTDEELQTIFSEHGTVESARIIKDRMTGRSRGFGFVEMVNDEEARKALEAVNGIEILGRRLNAREARPREEGAGNGAGGGATRPQNGERPQGAPRQREPQPQPQVIQRGVY